MHQFSLIAVLMIVAAAQGQDSEANKADLKKLQGTWIIKSSTSKALKEEGGRVTFENDKMSIAPPKGTKGGGEEGTFKIDATKKPKTLTFTPKDAKNAANAPRMIYEFAGETLRIVVAPPTKNPTEFSDKGQTLWTLKRESK